jgi:hypothetical protein
MPVDPTRYKGSPVTDRIALVLGIVIVSAFGLDLAANGGTASLFLLRKFDAMVEWIAFWR